MRLIVKLCSQGLLVLAALLSSSWSLLDTLHLVRSDGTVQMMGLITGTKASVELRLRVILSIGALLSIAATDLWDIYMPRKKLSDFRKEYLAQQVKTWRDQLGNEIRVSVLYARRRWYWPFWKVFEWSWNDGFKPPNHQDVNLGLACWQGVSGRAFKDNITKSAYYSELGAPNFREKYLFGNAYRLTFRQIKKTKGLKGIVSIPLLSRGQGDSPTYKSVGVINLDTRTDSGAELLKKNQVALANYFAEAGLLLGLLNV
jgi:hypothetical protein